MRVFPDVTDGTCSPPLMARTENSITPFLRDMQIQSL
jgi:hypothetical protein